MHRILQRLGSAVDATPDRDCVLRQPFRVLQGAVNTGLTTNRESALPPNTALYRILPGVHPTRHATKKRSCPSCVTRSGPTRWSLPSPSRVNAGITTWGLGAAKQPRRSMAASPWNGTTAAAMLSRLMLCPTSPSWSSASSLGARIGPGHRTLHGTS